MKNLQKIHQKILSPILVKISSLNHSPIFSFPRKNHQKRWKLYRKFIRKWKWAHTSSFYNPIFAKCIIYHQWYIIDSAKTYVSRNYLWSVVFAPLKLWFMKQFGTFASFLRGSISLSMIIMFGKNQIQFYYVYCTSSMLAPVTISFLIIFSFSLNLFDSSRNSFWNWYSSTYWTYRWSWGHHHQYHHHHCHHPQSSS